MRRNLLLGALAGLAAGAPVLAAAETHVVEISNMQFVPAEIDVHVGDTITWVNKDVVVHTATAKDGAWDSGPMKHGAEWSLTVSKAGVIDYACTYHPVMKGAINAQ